LAARNLLFGPVPQFASRFSEFVTEVTTCAGVSGLTVSVANRQETIYAEGFGMRNMEENHPVQNTTLFGIGSTSKAFTAALLAMLDDDELLDLGTPVVELLPEFILPPDEDGIGQTRTELSRD
jgi:CubicO group peptidase (beta-lactamase class C family)